MKDFIVLIVLGSAALCLSAPTLNLEAKEDGCGGKPLDVLFLLDASSSVWGPNFGRQLQFVRQSVRQMDARPSRTRVGVITFSDTARLEFGLAAHSTRGAVLKAINQVQQTPGGCNTDSALLRATQEFDQNGRPGDDVTKLIVLVTDGAPDDADLAATQALLARRAGIHIFAIGVGDGIKKKDLIPLAGRKTFVHRVKSYRGLRALKKVFAVKACELDGEAATQSDKDSPVTMELTKAEKGCGGRPAEIVFVLDASGSIWGPDFQRQLQFVRDLVGVFEVSPEMARIGVLTYSDEPYQEFLLDKYTDTKHVMRAISDITQRRGDTATGKALHFMTTKFFTPERVRDGVVKIGVVITDGKSDDSAATERAAREAREEGIHLFAIGVGQAVDTSELRLIASEPADQYVFTVNNYNALTTIKEILAMKTCEVTAPPTTTTTPVPTTTKPKPTACGAYRPADIIFAMPSNAAPNETNQVLGMIGDVCSELNIGKDGVRVGIVPRECYPLQGFRLSDAPQKKDVMNKLKTDRYRAAKTSHIIRYMRQRSFNRKHGARKGAKRMGILVVDANSPTKTAAALKQATLARKKNIELFVVAVGRDSPRFSPEVLAGKPDSRHVLRVDNYHELRHVAPRLVQNLNHACIEK